MIKILTKTRSKITIIVVENREPYYFLIICNCKDVPLSLFFYQILASTLTRDEWSVYYKVYDFTANCCKKYQLCQKLMSTKVVQN